MPVHNLTRTARLARFHFHRHLIDVEMVLLHTRLRESNPVA